MSGWLVESEREVREAVAAMPPAFRCAAERSGTKDTVDDAAWERHARGECGCTEATR